RRVLFRSARGMLGIRIAAMIPGQLKRSPRMRSVGTPTVSVRLVELEMKVIAYTNSLITSENVKMTTVRIPGIEIGNTIRTSEPSREQPSMSAASSSSCGIDLKNPISSQTANGMVNDG